jgi:hypothetical protein
MSPEGAKYCQWCATWICSTQSHTHCLILFMYLFIYDLFNDGVIRLDNIVSNHIMISELEGMYNKSPWPNLGFYPGICLEGPQKYIGQGSSSLDWDLKPGPPKYKGVLQAQLWCSTHNVSCIATTAEMGISPPNVFCVQSRFHMYNKLLTSHACMYSCLPSIPGVGKVTDVFLDLIFPVDTQQAHPFYHLERRLLHGTVRRFWKWFTCHVLHVTPHHCELHVLHDKVRPALCWKHKSWWW